MTDLGNGRVSGPAAVIPTPSCIRARRVTAQQADSPNAASQQTAGNGTPAPRASGQSAASGGSQITLANSGSGRVTARAALGAVLTGVRLSGRDRQFLSRLVHWDKRNAASVASLLWRARLAGREESALAPRQLETVIAAICDAALYRSSGSAAAGCWDCEKIPGGRCAEHARDNDRARAYSELAATLSGRTVAEGMQKPLKISGYRHRTSVAS